MIRIAVRLACFLLMTIAVRAETPAGDPLAPPVSAGSVSISDLPVKGVEPFLAPPTDDNPLKLLPDHDKVDYAYGAFQRGFYLTAFSIAIELAKKGEPAAQTLVGYLYANGLGVPQKYTEAVTWYELAVKAGDIAATVELANLKALGLGTAKDQKGAAALLEIALSKGHSEAAYWLGLIYLDPDSGITDPKKAAANFRIAADQGSADAQYALASLLSGGSETGVDGDLAEAARLMGLAARAGHVPAEVEYAIMVFNGRGVAANEATAAAWFKLAASSGNAVAANRLARLYAAGRGVESNLVEAAKWHLRATAGGIKDEWLDKMMESLTPEDRAIAAKAAADGSGPLP